MKCQQFIILQVAAERVMSSIDFITSNSLFIYLCSSAQLCLCLCFLSSLSSLCLCCRLRLMDTRRWNLPSSGRTELPSLRRTPLESSFSQCCQDRTCRPSVKPREPGSKAALFHQGMFSLDSISTLLVKELHPDFLFFSLFFFLFFTCSKKQDRMSPRQAVADWRTQFVLRSEPEQ